MKPRIAIVRGKFLNKFEMQFYEPLAHDFALTGFGSLTPFHDTLAFPVIKLPSPMDIPEFPYKMPILNRLFVDAHYLVGLEGYLRGYDLVHTAETYYRYTQQALNAKRLGYVRKVIATVLENIPFNNEGIRGRKSFKLRSRTELDHIIALTERTKEALLLEGADPRKVTVISHFVDTDRFKPTYDQQRRIASKSRRDITILFSGRLEKYKGVMDILYAMKILSTDPQLSKYLLKVVFVGEGSLYKQMIAMERRLGISRLISHTSRSYESMPELYQSADIYVAPSLPTDTWQEQYNTTLLEAQASGLPIVTTTSGGIVENVGNAAVTVQPADPISLAGAIKSYIVDSRKRTYFAKKARKRAVSIHDISVGARKLTRVYENVLAS